MPTVQKYFSILTADPSVKACTAEFLPWLGLIWGLWFPEESEYFLNKFSVSSTASFPLNTREENKFVMVGCPINSKAIWNFPAVHCGALAKDPMCGSLLTVVVLAEDHYLGYKTWEKPPPLTQCYIILEPSYSTACWFRASYVSLPWVPHF